MHCDALTFLKMVEMASKTWQSQYLFLQLFTVFPAAM